MEDQLVDKTHSNKKLEFLIRKPKNLKTNQKCKDLLIFPLLLTKVFKYKFLDNFLLTSIKKIINLLLIFKF